MTPLLLSACAGASQYQQECAYRYDNFPEVFACTKNKLYNDPRDINPLQSKSVNAADTAEIVAYGEELNSQLRQHLITDEQARRMFAGKTAEIKARHEPAPLPIPQQGLH